MPFLPYIYAVYGHQKSNFQTGSNIYAIDIQQDNVSEARRRMQNVVFDFVNNYKNSADFLSALNTIIEANIIVGNTLSDPSKTG